MFGDAGEKTSRNPAKESIDRSSIPQFSVLQSILFNFVSRGSVTSTISGFLFGARVDLFVSWPVLHCVVQCVGNLHGLFVATAVVLLNIMIISIISMFFISANFMWAPEEK